MKMRKTDLRYVVQINGRECAVDDTLQLTLLDVEG